MSHLNHNGPGNTGSKSGRKLGTCHKTEEEQSKMGVLGIGEGKRRHSGGGQGKGRRLKYNQTE